jgi:hypothetical protein
VAGSCEHDNELLVSINGIEFTDCSTVNFSRRTLLHVGSHIEN